MGQQSSSRRRVAIRPRAGGRESGYGDLASVVPDRSAGGGRDVVGP